MRMHFRPISELYRRGPVDKAALNASPISPTVASAVMASIMSGMMLVPLGGCPPRRSPAQPGRHSC